MVYIYITVTLEKFNNNWCWCIAAVLNNLKISQIIFLIKKFAAYFMFKVLVLWECWGKKNRINLIIIKKLKKLNKKKPEPEVIKKIK